MIKLWRTKVQAFWAEECRADELLKRKITVVAVVFFLLMTPATIGWITGDERLCVPLYMSLAALGLCAGIVLLFCSVGFVIMGPFVYAFAGDEDGIVLYRWIWRGLKWVGRQALKSFQWYVGKMRREGPAQKKETQ